MAGLRFGILLSSPEIIKYINNYKPHYTVNSVALLVGTEVIKNYDKVSRLMYSDFAEGREYVFSKLSELGYSYLQTETCHLCILPKNKSADDVYCDLKTNGVLVGKGRANLENYIRITITSKKYMKKFIDNLLKVDIK